MIFAKTRLRKMPSCCRTCPYYHPEWANVYRTCEGKCGITQRSTAEIVVSRQRLASCPLTEIAVSGTDKPAGMSPEDAAALKTERDAAVRDFERAAQTGSGYCHVCAGGLGGSCIHKDDYVEIGCVNCRMCECAECLESSGFPHFKWKGPKS